MYVISLDLSTTVIGYSIFKDKELVKCDFYKFKEKELIERGEELYAFLKELFAEYDMTSMTFVIEERLKSFAGGRTNANAMLNTAQMNFC